MKLASYEAVRLTRGKKHVCQDCETRFYDLMRSPIICPSCGAQFKPQIAVKPPPVYPRNRWRQDFAPRPSPVQDVTEARDDAISGPASEEEITADDVKSSPEPADDRIPDEVQDDGDITDLLDFE